MGGRRDVRDRRWPGSAGKAELEHPDRVTTIGHGRVDARRGSVVFDLDGLSGERPALWCPVENDLLPVLVQARER